MTAAAGTLLAGGSFSAPGPGLEQAPGLGPVQRPCQPWATALCGVPDPALPAISPTNVALGIQVATELLWALSGRRFGICNIAVRPCRKDPNFNTPNWPWLGYFWPDSAITQWPRFWLLPIGCGCQGDCSCTYVPRVRLAKTPVRAIAQVKVDGVVLPPNQYRVDNWRDLVRLDPGKLDWPICQDLNLDDNQVGTWSVLYAYGTPPPASGALACGQLGFEIAKLCSGQPCSLPQRIQTISRQGMAATFIDLHEFLSKGRTGMYLVDLFLTAFNRNGIQSRSRVYRADAHGGQVIVNT